ncbi:hypothetical protein D3C75_741950 [compost metagenome]
MVQAGGNQVGADQPVGGKAAEEEGAGQKPEGFAFGCGAQRLKRGQEQIPRKRRWFEQRLFSVRGSPYIIRMIAHEKSYEDGQNGNDRYSRINGGPPAEGHRNFGQERQEKQLSGCGTGSQKANHQPFALHKPMVGDGYSQHIGHHACAQSCHQPPQQIKLPDGGHQRRYRKTGGQHSQRDDHHPPDAEALQKGCAEGAHQPVQKDADGDHTGNIPPAPAEILLQRQHQNTGHGANARRYQQSSKGNKNHKPTIIQF